VDSRFGCVFCLGNTLVNLQEPEALAAACRAVHDLLMPGGSWVVQILNYARLQERNQRALPVQVLPDEEGELVFLRLLRPLPEGRLQFFATTLRLRPEAEAPLEILASRVSVVRPWLQTHLEAAMAAAGFSKRLWFGDLRGTPFVPSTSSDLVCVASR
jgi:hypothetical protein